MPTENERHEQETDFTEKRPSGRFVLSVFGM